MNKKVEIRFTREQCDLRHDYVYVPLKDQDRSFRMLDPKAPITLAFEVSIIEPVVTITPSEFDKIMNKLFDASGIVDPRTLKQKLFPGWKE